MDNPTLIKMETISQLMYVNDVHHFVLFCKSYVVVSNQNMDIKLTYKKWRDAKNFNYSIYDKINKDISEYKDFRLVMKKLNEIMGL